MKALPISLLVIALAGCADGPGRRLQQAEEAFQTDGETTLLFHSSLYYPNELSLSFDGYIIGVEKSPRELISTPGDVRIQARADSGLDEESAREQFVDRKLLFISHIVESHPQGSGAENCTLHNVYNLKLDKPVQQLAAPCQNGSPQLPPNIRENAFKDSWQALARLQTSLRHRIDSGKYTDIIVITMGWNTVQEEAIRNFNSIGLSLKASSKRPFNPIVIGVTWPSQWNNPWVEPIYRLFSFPIKSADADELGMSWLGVLLHQTLPPIQGNLPVTVIGHSFGSRAASMAACVGPVIFDKAPNFQRAEIQNLINLQGAFAVSRLFNQPERGIQYGAWCRNVKNLVLTASKHDEAVKTAFWSPYAGTIAGYKEKCPEDGSTIRCGRANADGSVTQLNAIDSNIFYVDASELIKENAYLSGGGAHSDIYRKEHGNLISNLISDGPSPRPKVATTAAPQH